MDIFDVALEALRLPPLRIGMDHFEFDGTASLCEVGDLFEISGFIGEVLRIDADTILFEWRVTPEGLRDGEKEVLSAEAEGRISFSKHSGRRRQSPEQLQFGDCFFFGQLIWAVTTAGRCRVISPTGDLAFEAQLFPVSSIDGCVYVLKLALAEHLLRLQYEAAKLSSPEELFAELHNLKGKTMSQCPTPETLLKDIQGFPKKLVKAVCTAYEGCTEANATFTDLMFLSWNKLFVEPGCLAGAGGNSGSNALAVFLTKWGIEKQQMGPHFVHPGSLLPTETEAAPEEPAVEAEAKTDGLDGSIQVLDFIRQTYPDFDSANMMQVLNDGTGRKYMQLLELQYYDWEQLCQKGGETFASHLYGALQTTVGETLELPFADFLRQNTPAETATADIESGQESMPLEETAPDTRLSVFDFTACQLSEYFDFSGAVSRGIADAVTDFTGAVFASWTREEVEATFDSPEQAQSFFEWVQTSFALEGAVSDSGEAIFVWASSIDAEEAADEVEDQLGPEAAAWMQAFFALPVEERVRALAKLNEDFPF